MRETTAIWKILTALADLPFLQSYSTRRKTALLIALLHPRALPNGCLRPLHPLHLSRRRHLLFHYNLHASLAASNNRPKPRNVPAIISPSYLRCRVSHIAYRAPQPRGRLRIHELLTHPTKHQTISHRSTLHEAKATRAHPRANCGHIVRRHIV